MDIRLVALDLDGTTLSPDGAISDENIRSIREASEPRLTIVNPFVLVHYAYKFKVAIITF